MRELLNIVSLYIFAFFATLLSSHAAAEESQGSMILSKPDHILSGTLPSGKLWKLEIYCSGSKNEEEGLHGVLSVNSITQNSGQEGTMLETSLGEIVYFGKSRKDATAVTGWYFSGWPQTCSYLPK